MSSIYLPDSTDPFENIAFEERLLSTLGDGEQALMLWRNEPCVVIGRHQNPWIECDLPAMAEDRVELVRRISGGGAVYHDPGNLNFSFLTAPDRFDLDRQFDLILEALTRLGLPAERNERNDLTLAGRKISGNAFRHTSGYSLHHGTILVDADIDLLSRFLASSHEVTGTKSIASVRSAVVTLRMHRPGLTWHQVRDAIVACYREHHGGTVEPSGPTPLASRVAELRGWEWRYGMTPRFHRSVAIDRDPGPPDTASTASGRNALIVEVYHGRIVGITSSPGGGSTVGPPLSERLAERLAEVLIGKRYVGAEIVAAADRRDELRPVIERIAEGVV